MQPNPKSVGYPELVRLRRACRRGTLNRTGSWAGSSYFATVFSLDNYKTLWRLHMNLFS
jgi:hypothetical protein